MIIKRRNEVDGYIQELSGYEIFISDSNYYHWRDMISSGTPFDPSVIGFLIGRAKPKYVKRTCKCGKTIKIKDACKRTDERLKTIDWDWKQFMHEKCVLEIESKESEN